MKIEVAGILIFFLTITSCQQPVHILTDEEKVVIISDIKLTLNEYFEDIKKMGFTAELKYLDSTSEFFWVPPGYASSITYDSVATVLKQNATAYKMISNSWDTLSIKPLTNNLAAYTGTVYSVILDSAGKTSDFFMMETGVLIKRSDGWKLLSGQTSIINK